MGGGQGFEKLSFRKGINFGRQLLICLTLFGSSAEARPHTQHGEKVIQQNEGYRENLRLRKKWQLLKFNVENYSRPYQHERLAKFEALHAQKLILWKQEEIDAKEDSKRKLEPFVERIIYLNNALKSFFLEIESTKDSHNRVDIQTVLRETERVNNAVSLTWAKELDMHLTRYYQIMHLLAPIVGEGHFVSEDFWRSMRSQNYAQFEEFLQDYQIKQFTGADFAVEANLRDLKNVLDAFSALSPSERKEIFLRASLGQMPQDTRELDTIKAQQRRIQ